MKTLKSIMITLLPWFFYEILNGYLGVSVIYASMISSLILIFTGYKFLIKGFFLSWTILIILLSQICIQYFFYNSFIQKDPWIISNLLLAIISWFSLMLHKPITMQYAKTEVPSEKWIHPTFIKINNVLTAAWGVIFTLSFVCHVILFYFKNYRHIIVSMIYMLSVLGILFIVYYPKYERNRNKKNSYQSNVN